MGRYWCKPSHERILSAETRELTASRIGHVANTTSPPLQQLLDIPGIEALRLSPNLDGVCSGGYACPVDLVLELVRINDIRLRQAVNQQRRRNMAHGQAEISISNGATEVTSFSPASNLRSEAGALITRLITFDPAGHAKSEHHAARIRLGRIFRSALLIFANSSLHIPYEAKEDIRSVIRSEADWLACEIERSVKVSGKRRILFYSLLWPTISLGVYAAVDAPRHRDVVRQCLLRMSFDLGTAQSLQAKEVLEKFWLSGGSSWNACFDKPYSFMTV